MRYTAKEIVDIFKSYPENEVIFMWFKDRQEFDGVVDITEEQWGDIADWKDWIYDYVNSIMFDLVCEKVDEGGSADQKNVKLLWSKRCSKVIKS